MMLEPYKILGVPSTASDDEIKKVYRKLSRMYHPDANLNNPNKAKAEEKFKEVQQAYDQIMKERTGGYSGYGSSQGQTYEGFGGWGYGQRTRESSEPIEFQAAANYINAGHFKEALNVLNSLNERNGRWYFLSAMANAGMGNNLSAREHAQKAVELEPDNAQYQQLVQQLDSGGQWYQTMGRGYGMPKTFGTDCCSQLCLINLFCNCCWCRPC